MGYDRGDSFPFNFGLNGIPFGSKFKFYFMEVVTFGKVVHVGKDPTCQSSQ